MNKQPKTDLTRELDLARETVAQLLQERRKINARIASARKRVEAVRARLDALETAETIATISDYLGDDSPY